MKPRKSPNINTHQGKGSNLHRRGSKPRDLPLVYPGMSLRLPPRVRTSNTTFRESRVASYTSSRCIQICYTIRAVKVCQIFFISARISIDPLMVAWSPKYLISLPMAACHSSWRVPSPTRAPQILHRRSSVVSGCGIL